MFLAFDLLKFYLFACFVLFLANGCIIFTNHNSLHNSDLYFLRASQYVLHVYSFVNFLCGPQTHSFFVYNIVNKLHGFYTALIKVK